MRKLFFISLLAFVQNNQQLLVSSIELQENLAAGNAHVLVDLQDAISSTYKFDHDNVLYSPLTLLNSITSTLLVTKGDKHAEIAKSLKIRKIDTANPHLVNNVLAEHTKQSVKGSPASGSRINEFYGHVIWKPSEPVPTWYIKPTNNAALDSKHTQINDDVIADDISKWTIKKNREHRFLMEEPNADKTPHAFLYSYFDFEAELRDPFRSAGKQLFETFSGGKTKVEMISGLAELPYFEDKAAGVSVVGLPIKDQNMTLYLMLPKNPPSHGVVEVQERMTAEKLMSMIDNAEKTPQTIQVTLPRLNLKNTLHLSNAFKSLGIYELFHKTSHYRKRRSVSDMLFKFNRLSEKSIMRTMDFLKEKEEQLQSMFRSNNKTPKSSNIKRFQFLLWSIYKYAKEFNLTVEGEPTNAKPVHLDADFIYNITSFAETVYSSMHRLDFTSDSTISDLTKILMKYQKDVNNVQPAMQHSLTPYIHIQSMLDNIRIASHKFHFENDYDTDAHNDISKRHAEHNLYNEEDVRNINKFFLDVLLILKDKEESNEASDMVRPLNIIKTYQKAKKVGKFLYHAFNTAKSAKKAYDSFKEAMEDEKKESSKHYKHKKGKFSKRSTYTVTVPEEENINQKKERAADEQYLPQLQIQKIRRVHKFIENLKDVLNTTHVLVNPEETWKPPVNLDSIEKLLKKLMVAAKKTDLLMKPKDDPKNPEKVINHTNIKKLEHFAIDMNEAFQILPFIAEDKQDVEQLIEKLENNYENKMTPEKLSQLLNMIRKIPKVLRVINKASAKVVHTTSEKNAQKVEDFTNRDLKNSFPGFRQKRGTQVSGLMLLEADINHVTDFLSDVMNVLKSYPILNANADNVVLPPKFSLHIRSLLKLQDLLKSIKEAAKVGKMIAYEINQFESNEVNSAHKTRRSDESYNAEIKHGPNGEVILNKMIKRSVGDYIPLLKKTAIVRVLQFVENIKEVLKVSDEMVNGANTLVHPKNLVSIQNIVGILLMEAKQKNLLSESNDVSRIPVNSKNLQNLKELASVMNNALETFRLTIDDVSKIEQLAERLNSQEMNVEPLKWDKMAKYVSKVPKIMKYLNKVAKKVEQFTSDEHVDKVDKFLGKHVSGHKKLNEVNKAGKVSSKTTYDDFNYETESRKKRSVSLIHELEPILYEKDIAHILTFLDETWQVLMQNVELLEDSNVSPLKLPSFNSLLKLKKIINYIKKGASFAQMLSSELNDDDRSKRSLPDRDYIDIFDEIYEDDLDHMPNDMIHRKITKRSVGNFIPLLKKTAMVRVLQFLENIKEVLKVTNQMVNGANTLVHPKNLVNIENLLGALLMEAKKLNLLSESKEVSSIPVNSKNLQNLKEFASVMNYALEMFHLTIDDVSKVEQLAERLDNQQMNVEPLKWDKTKKIVSKIPKIMKYLNKIAKKVEKFTSDEHVHKVDKFLGKHVAGHETLEDAESRKKRSVSVIHELEPILYEKDIAHILTFLDETWHVLMQNVELLEDNNVTPLKLPSINSLLKLKKIIKYIKKGASIAQMLSSELNDDDRSKRSLPDGDYIDILDEVYGDDLDYVPNDMVDSKISKRSVGDFIPLLKKTAVMGVLKFVKNIKGVLEVTNDMVNGPKTFVHPKNLVNIQKILEVLFMEAKRMNLLSESIEVSSIPVNRTNLQDLKEFASVMNFAMETFPLTIDDVSKVEQLAERLSNQETNVEPLKWDKMKSIVSKVPKVMKYLNKIAKKVEKFTRDEHVDKVDKFLGKHVAGHKTLNEVIEDNENEVDEISPGMTFEDLSRESESRKKRSVSLIHELEPVLYENDVAHVLMFLDKAGHVLMENMHLFEDNNVTPFKLPSINSLLKLKKIVTYIKKGASFAQMLSAELNDDNRRKRSLYGDDHAEAVSKDNIFFSEVIHNAKMVIRESNDVYFGNEVELTTAPSVIFNKPFFFIVKHDTTNFYLLYGIVNHPQQ